MNSVYFLIMIGCVMITFNSCNDKDGDTTFKLSKIDIQNSKTLFIASTDGNTTTSSSQNNRLFKVTDNGIVEEVSYFDEAGKQIKQTLVPDMIYFIADSDYFIARIDYITYLIRKTDGAVFALNVYLGPFRADGGYLNSDFIVQDSKKNLYFTNEIAKAYKLDVSNPEKITLSLLSPDTESALDLTVSAKGDVLYRGNDTYRVIKSTGGLFNLPHGHSNSLNSWKGLDAKIKYLTGSSIFTLDVDENGNVSTTEKPLVIYSASRYDRIFRFSDRIILLHNQALFLEVENSSNTPRNIHLAYGINIIKEAVHSNNYYYISGLNSSQQPFLIKVNPANDAVTELFNTGDYDIYAMTVSKDNELIFNALRMSDGVKVIGRVSSTGNLEIIDTKLNTEVKVLERIQ